MRPPWDINGSTASLIRIVPFTLQSIVFSASSALKLDRYAMPALFTRMSTFPYFSFNVSAQAVIEAGFVTSSSQKSIVASGRSALSLATAFCPSFGFRAVTTVVSPSRARWRTISYPRPLLEPVTTATVDGVHLQQHRCCETEQSTAFKRGRTGELL